MGRLIAILAAYFATVFVVFVAAIIWAYAAPAHAHETWIDGTQVDPSTKRYCCGENDVTHLEREQVRVVAKGYQIDTGEVIPFERAQPSPDGEYWRFTWGGSTACFFAPVPGT